MVGKDLANEELTTSIAEIIRLNASAVGLSIFIGSEYERRRSRIWPLWSICARIMAFR